jgi:PPP family 3-phenylpropionic acid transporter
MPYWRLSGFYFFYFATLGVLVPYFGLYLKSVGFSPAEIGQLMAIVMLSRIVAPLVWGWVADHRESRMAVVRVASFLTLVAFIGVFYGTGFAWLAAVLLLFSFFWHASLPLLEVFTMSHLGSRPGAYGRVRLWGSIGFIAAVYALGPVMDIHGPWWVLPAITVLVGGICLFALALPESPLRGEAEHREPFLAAIARPEVFGFLAASFLMQLGHGPYYTFYSIYLEAYGYSKTLIGGLWAFAVVCEIGVFLLMGRILARFELRQVLLASFAAAALRWLLIGFFPQDLAVLVVAQTLHAATFGSFHAAAIQMVHRFFTGRHRHRGQAVYGSASFGIGGAVGAYYSGQAWETLGPAATFAVAAGCAVAALAVAWRLLRRERL